MMKNRVLHIAIFIKLFGWSILITLLPMASIAQNEGEIPVQLFEGRGIVIGEVHDRVENTQVYESFVNQFPAYPIFIEFGQSWNILLHNHLYHGDTMLSHQLTYLEDFRRQSKVLLWMKEQVNRGKEGEDVLKRVLFFDNDDPDYSLEAYFENQALLNDSENEKVAHLGFSLGDSVCKGHYHFIRHTLERRRFCIENKRNFPHAPLFFGLKKEKGEFREAFMEATLKDLQAPIGNDSTYLIFTGNFHIGRGMGELRDKTKYPPFSANLAHSPVLIIQSYPKWRWVHTEAYWEVELAKQVEERGGNDDLFQFVPVVDFTDYYDYLIVHPE